MAQRGRKSAASLSVAPTAIDAARQRPPPPDYLLESQAELWRKTVSALPAGWIRPEHHEVLADFCRHAIRARDLAMRVDAFDVMKLGDIGSPIDTFDKLRRAAESETRAMLACARSLRLTITSQTRAETAATRRADSSNAPPPWEIGK